MKSGHLPILSGQVPVTAPGW